MKHPTVSRVCAAAIFVSSSVAVAQSPPVLTLHGTPQVPGTILMDLKAPDSPGKDAFVAIGIDPLLAPIQTTAGPYYSSSLLLLSRLGKTDNNGSLQRSESIPSPAAPALLGRALMIQALIENVLSTPASLPLVDPYYQVQNAHPLLSPSQGSTRFGTYMSEGDLNGDGFADVVITGRDTVNEMSNAGRVTVMLGPTFIPTLTLSPPKPAAQGNFGDRTVVRDLNGDSFDDLLVSATEAFPTSEVIYIYHGSENGLSTTPDLRVVAPLNLGISLLLADDIDGDGFVDIAIGNPTWPDSGLTSVGRIDFFYGPDYLSHGVLVNPDPGESEFFGDTFALGDVDDDGFVDLVVGAGRADVGAELKAGELYVFQGPSMALSETLVSPLGPEAQDRFGAVVLVTDLDQDGIDDIVATSGRTNVVFRNSQWTAPSTFDRTLLPDGQTTSSQNGYASARVQAGDVDGDGFADLVFAEPLGPCLGCVPSVGSAGIVSIAYGPYFRTGRILSNVSPVIWEAFGLSILVADVAQGSRPELLVGIPGPGSAVGVVKILSH